MNEPAPVTERLAHHWWALCLFVSSFLVRVHWNLEAHPIGQFLYSDMRGYNGRADKLINKFGARGEYNAFFPPGTAYLLAPVKLVFGQENFAAIGVFYALLGAFVVVISYWIARRLGPRPWVAPTVGLVLVVYYPLISLGGYILSEIPAALCMTTATLLLLRLAEDGHARDAWGAGVAAGIGIAIRPQILVTAGLFLLYWLIVGRKAFPRITWTRIGQIAVPVLVFLGACSGRFYYQTGQVGLVSGNGSINQVFGRCHNKGLYSMPDGEGHGRVRFAPPPLIQLEKYSYEHPDSWFQLDPAFGDHARPYPAIDGFTVDQIGCRTRSCYLPGSELQYRGYIGDREVHRAIVRDCLRRTGVKRQLYYSLTHVVQLWRFNLVWPDQANPKPRPVDQRQGWSTKADAWKRVHNVLFAIPGLLGLAFLLFPHRHGARALVALNLLALVVTAAAYIGGMRLRIPYDPFIILLAFQVVALTVTWVRGQLGRANNSADDQKINTATSS